MKILTSFIWMLLVLAACNTDDSSPDWYLAGGDIHLTLDWKNEHILLSSNTEDIFSGVILSKEEKDGLTQIHTRLDKVSEHYESRYKDLRNDFILWLKNPQKGVLKVTMSQLSSVAYTFLSNPSIETFMPYKQGKFLSEAEISQFLKEGTFYNIATHYATTITNDIEAQMSHDEVVRMENNPYRRWLKDKYSVSNALSFYQMTDYLQDLDPSTAFITKETSENLSFEYLINERRGDIPVPISQPISLRALYIVPGNLDNSAEYYKYRRPKSLKIYFSTQNSEGLGNTRGNYNEKAIRVLLSDEKVPKVLYFYKPILAKSISVYVDEYYGGDRDEMAIFDLAFFAGNS